MENNKSDFIIPFYKDKTVFLSGGTGFVGKVVIEVLLRETEVKKIYLIVRSKNNEDSRARLHNELLNSSIFEWMRTQRDDFNEFALSKLEVISGDLMQENMAINQTDKQKVIENAEIFIHCAATVRFDEPLDLAVNLNILGALRMLDLAKQAKNLISFTHVSTAYVNCNRRGFVEDKIYRGMDDPEKRLEELMNMSKSTLLKKERQILKKNGYPNTYTFTKSLTEQLLEERKGNVPLNIVRPTIIGAAYVGMHNGWIDNAQAAGAFFLACGLGVMKVVQGSIWVIGDMIPVDMVVHCVLAASVNAHNNPEELKVFHIGTSAKNPNLWRYTRSDVVGYFRQHPPKKAVSVPDFLMVPNTTLYEFLFTLGYRVPIGAMNLYANWFGTESQKKLAQKAIKMKELAYKISTEFCHFVVNEWIYSSKNSDVLYSKLSSKEKKIFDFDTTNIDWHSYIRANCWGLATYVLKDKKDPHPNEERIVPMYFERRLHSMFTDLRWAYYNSPRLDEMYAVQRNIDDTFRLILTSKRVTKAIEDHAKLKNLPKESVSSQARKILDTMGGDFYMPLMRLMAWAFRKIYRMMYDNVLIDERGVHRIKQLLKNIKDKNIALVLVPTHRSYLDFLMMSYIMFAYDLPIPRIAAGDDFLNMMLVRWIFRHSGAFFMRRTFKDDHLYKAIFAEYVHRLMLDGFPVEFFVEGTRSRTGKNLSPKMGLLSVATEAYFNKQVSDIVFLPISINYEKYVEGEKHVGELLGENKKLPTLNKFLESIFGKVLNTSYGRINVQFAEEIYFSNFIEKCKTEHGLQDPKSHPPAKYQVIERLAYRLLHDFNKESICMSTSILSAIMLANRHGLTFVELCEKYEWVSKLIEERGFRVDFFRDQTTEFIVKRGLKLLGDDAIITKHNLVQIKLEKKEHLNNFALLGLYRNQLPHIFFGESVLCCAYYSLQKEASEEERGVSVKDLISRSQFLANLLRVEFHTSVDPKNVINFEDVLNTSVSRNLFTLGSGQVLANETTEETFIWLCSLLWPFIDAYWVSSLALLSLQTSEGIEESRLYDRMIWLTEKLFHDNVIFHFDACSKEIMKCAVLVYKEDGILVTKNDKLHLFDSFLNDEKKISSFSNSISAFRKVPLNPVDRNNDISRKSLIPHFPALLSKI